MKKLFIPLLLLLPSLALGQTVQKGSLFGSTNKLVPGDAFVTSLAYGTINEHLKIIEYTNVLNEIGAATRLLSGLAVGGDSLSTETGSPTATTSAIGQGSEWPQQLFTNATWRFHLPHINLAYGGALSQSWSASNYTANVHPQAINFLPWTYWFSFECGVNDVAAGASLTTITNSLATVWAKARADNMFVAAWTIPWDTNNIGNAANLAVWTNVNNALPSMAGLYDVLVPMPLITNATVQLLDNVHPTTVQNARLAKAFSDATLGNPSSSWTNFYATEVTLDTVTATTMANLYSARITGLLNNAYGAGLELQYDNTVGNSGAKILSYDRTHSTYREIDVDGSVVALSAHSGPIVVSGYLTNSAGPGIYFGSTNGPTFGAGNGSIYSSSLGGFFVRTNNAWFAIKLN